MGFINLGRLNIRKRNSYASALVSLSDLQPPSVYKSHILNGPINKLYLLLLNNFHIDKLLTVNIDTVTDTAVRGPGVDTRFGLILSFLHPLIQEGQLSVNGESMCTGQPLRRFKPAQEKCG